MAKTNGAAVKVGSTVSTETKKGKKMQIETRTNVKSAAEAYGFTAEEIQAQIDAGNIGKFAEPVMVKVGVEKNAAGKAQKQVRQPYEKLFAITYEGVMFLVRNKVESATAKPSGRDDDRTEYQKAPGLVDHFNYGHDLEIKRPIREEIEAQTAGPDKTILAAANRLVKGKLATDLTEALEMVKGMLAAKGKI